MAHFLGGIKSKIKNSAKIYLKLIEENNFDSVWLFKSRVRLAIRVTGRLNYHFNDLDLRLDPQVVQELLQILLHLYRIVLHLRDCEDPHFAVLPSAMLLQQERQQHQETAIVHDPPNVDVADDFLGGVREEIYPLRHQQRHLRGRDAPDGLQEDSPGPLLLGLPPAVRPAQYHSIRLQSAQPCGLYQRAQSVNDILDYEDIDEALDFLLDHGLPEALLSR